MAATKLSLFNGALGFFVGERELSSLTENREPRRLLDAAWNNGAVDYCLEQGQWNFAMRTARVDYDPDLTPDFGYRRAFSKPDDWVRTAALCSDEYFNCPLTRYSDEVGYWFSDLDVIYVRYVSNDAAYGNDLSRWPKSFTHYVESHLALRISKRLTQSTTDREALKKESRKLLIDARSKDAMNEATSFMPQGRWSAARMRGLVRNRTESSY